jgi:undecaprenyl phosphate-alpha-L-ara4FN deformylase
LDELMGRPEYPDDRLVPHLVSLLRPDALNVFTLHAEIEGMGRRAIFQQLLAAIKAAGVEVVSLEAAARALLADRAGIPVCELQQGSVDGRSGLVAVQGPAA